jgi:hypothetical protein
MGGDRHVLAADVRRLRRIRVSSRILRHGTLREGRPAIFRDRETENIART